MATKKKNKRSLIKDRLLNKFDQIECYLTQKNLSNDLIHLMQVALICNTINETAYALGIQRERMSVIIRSLYAPFENELNATTKFTDLMNVLDNIDIDTNNFQPFERSPLQKIQLLIASKDISRVTLEFSDSILRSSSDIDNLDHWMRILGKSIKSFYQTMDDIKKEGK